MIRNPYIRDTITIDDAFNARLATFGGGDSIYLLARVVDQQVDLVVGPSPVVFVVDEFRGNGFLVNAIGASLGSVGGPGTHAGPTAVTNPGAPGGNGGDGGAGSRGGTVTLMCRRSSGVRISVSGGAGASGGPGGNGGPGSPATSTPGGTTTEIVFDSEGNPSEVEVQLPDIETPGTLGGGGGLGGNGGPGGDAGSITFIGMVDQELPTFEASGGAGGPGGPGGLTGAHGAFAEIPQDVDFSPVPGAQGAFGADGTISVTTLSEEEYVAALRPLLDAEGRDFANHWAPYRVLVGEFFYREFRKSTPLKGQLAADEFTRCLELQPDNSEALRWRAQLMELPRPLPDGAPIEWQPGGLNALALSRDLDVLPRFTAYRDAFTSFGNLVLQFLNKGLDVTLSQADIKPWEDFLDEEKRKAENAHKKTIEERADAETEARLANDVIARVQARLDQTTQDINAALAEMKDEEISILGFVGTIAGLAGAVVAVIAAVPSAGTSLVALAPAMVALSGAVIDNAEPIAKALFAGDKANTDAIKKEYGKVETEAAAVVKGAKAIADFVKVVQEITKVTTKDNTKHMTLVRHGVELTHELLLARHRITQAEQRLNAAGARVDRAAAEIAGVQAVKDSLVPTKEALRTTGLHAIGIAESKADALLTIAFHAQRSVEIYNLSDHEDSVRLESGHLHPDHSRAYAEEEIDGIQLVRHLNDSWKGLLDLVDLQLDSDEFFNSFPDTDQRRLSFKADGIEVAALRATGRFSFRLDPNSLPDGHFDAKVQAVRMALVGAKTPANEVTCEIRHGSTYESRGDDNLIHTAVLQPRGSHRKTKLQKLNPDEGFGPDSVLTDPRSLAFWGRGIGGEWEFVIPRHELEAGLDLTGLTEVQVWIAYQFVR